MVWRHDMPTPQGNETPYRVPASASTRLVYRGWPLDQIEDQIVSSSAWKQVEALLLPKKERAGGRPITPLHAGHVGLLCTAGLLNGVFGQGQERHIARRRSVKSVTVFEVKEKGYTEVHKREQFTNELALVYEDGRTLVLGDGRGCRTHICGWGGLSIAEIQGRRTPRSPYTWIATLTMGTTPI
jgi:hypothetical protein